MYGVGKGGSIFECMVQGKGGSIFECVLGLGRGVYLSVWCREGSIFECMV